MRADKFALSAVRANVSDSARRSSPDSLSSLAGPRRLSGLEGRACPCPASEAKHRPDWQGAPNAHSSVDVWDLRFPNCVISAEPFCP